MLTRYLDVFKSLRNREVKYVVIGGIAAVPYGVPRATFDLDMLIEPSDPNAKQLLDAFADAGLGTARMTTSKDILLNETTILNDRVRIDV